MVAPVVGRPLSHVLMGETKRNWPFVVGFGVTFALVLKLSSSLDRQRRLTSQSSLIPTDITD